MFQSTTALLSHLNDLGVKLWAEEDKLRCNAPPGVLTAELKTLIVDRRFELVDLLNKVDIGMTHSDRGENVSLSFSQQRLWFLDQLEGPSWVYNIPLAWRFIGKLDVAALEKSIAHIVQRHDALRTTFGEQNGNPVQIIAPHIAISLPLIDLSDQAADLREEEVRHLATEECRQIFDLSQGPLLRCVLLRLNSREHVFLLTIHHIIFDGWSVNILGRELSLLYKAFCTGGAPNLPAISMQYAELADKKRRQLQGKVLENQLGYWKKQLTGAPPVLELPIDRSQDTYQRFQGAHQTRKLPLQLLEELKTLSIGHGSTLFMTLLAVFQLLLHRITGQTDIVVGAPMAGRNFAGDENTIGFFVNTLALRTDLSGRPTFKELLGRVREMTLDAYTYQDLPFERIVEELQPERNASRNPLFEVMFNLINSSWQNWDLNELMVRYAEIAEPPARFSLELYAKEMTDGIQLDLVYSMDRFSPERIMGLMDQLVYLISQVIDDPTKPIDAYSLVTPNARLFLPDPRIALDEPAQEPVPRTFLDWARRMPRNTAVIQGEVSWTYQELANRAGILADQLCTQGSFPGDVVAVSGPVCCEVIAGMVGVLLAGRVLLPVDDNLPLNRKRLLIEESSAKVLLVVSDASSEDVWWESIRGSNGISVIYLDKLFCATERSETRNLFPTLSADDPAYIFFTSGTTGKPKGVLGCHKSLSHFLHWQRETFTVGPKDRVAQLTSLSFDPVLRDIFLPLTSGGCVVLPEPVDQLDMLSWLERSRITILHIVPSVARFWLDKVPENISLGHLRWVFFSGEPLADSLVERWRKVFSGGGQIVNLYGPTESTMVRCFFQLPEEIEPGIQSIGRPLPESQALVLSENARLCGIGEPGEIVLRTPFLTLGYINASPDQQTGFSQNPFRNAAEDRLYHTGDRGCFRPDGTLEFLGRLDDQVKIGGVRIEPAEVTAVLTRHPGVKDGVVTARMDDKGKPFLAAYIVPESSPPQEHRELRSFLLKHLPAVMVPRAFVNIEKLPLTPNGKTDFAALPDPDRQASDTLDSYEAPRTSTEIRLTDIWRDVLGVERMGIHNNFFESGGHSLLALQVMSRIESAFNIKIFVRALFDSPTIAELALHIERIQSPESDDDKATPSPRYSHPLTEEGMKTPIPHRRVGPSIPAFLRSAAAVVFAPT